MFRARHPSGCYSDGDLMALPDFPSRCRVEVYHHTCDPDPDRGSYWLQAQDQHGVELPDTVAHLLGKLWFGAEEARELIYRYLNGATAAALADGVGR